MAEKATVILNSVAGVEEGKTNVFDEGGISALAEVIEDGFSVKWNEFVVVTLLHFCEGINGMRNRGLLVLREQQLYRISKMYWDDKYDSTAHIASLHRLYPA
ncbi:hypothetical protein Tco_1151364 [Tanacetum coccineum]